MVQTLTIPIIPMDHEDVTPRSVHAMVSSLIGLKGRNITLLCKMANVNAIVEPSNEHDQMVFFTKNHKSNLEKAHMLMISMMSGGVLGWFNHPDVTRRFFHPSARNELKAFVEEHTNSSCTLKLVRANNGHRCLLVVPKKNACLTHVGLEIRDLHAKVMEKIHWLAAQNL
jgi:hypothetical protein